MNWCDLMVNVKRNDQPIFSARKKSDRGSKSFSFLFPFISKQNRWNFNTDKICRIFFGSFACLYFFYPNILTGSSVNSHVTNVTINRFSVRGRGATVEARVFRFFFPLLVNETDGTSILIKFVEFSLAVSLVFTSFIRIS